MFIRLGVFIFGLLFVIRISRFNIENKVFESTFFEKVIWSSAFLTLLVVICVFRSIFLVWMAVFFVIFIFAVTIFVTRKRRETEFRQDFVDYLDRVITFVRSGQGFLASLEKANATSSRRYQKKIQKIVESLHFTSQPEFQNAFVAEIFDEFLWMKSFPSKTLQRLLSFRRNLHIEEKFRRKSGRIIRQAAIQALFLLFLYVCLLFFVGSYLGFQENWRIFLVSGGLFLSGMVLFYLLGSRKLWKI
jgi:Flp pilus assembly protein TadB